MDEIIEKRKRIGGGVALIMIGIALLFDFVQGLLTSGFIGVVLSTFISIFAWLTFYLWFKLQGVGFLDGRAVFKAVTFWGGGVIELIPVVNALPAWTFSVVLMILIVKLEDILYNKKMEKGKRKIKLPRRQYE